MTNLERLKLELSNKSYYTDNEYNVFLNENNLIPTDTYNKDNNEIDLLKTVVIRQIAKEKVKEENKILNSSTTKKIAVPQ